MISGLSGLFTQVSLKAKVGRRLAKPQSGAQPQQAAFGALVGGQGIELVAAHRAQKNRI